jgi:hypothetical protein
LHCPNCGNRMCRNSSSGATRALGGGMIEASFRARVMKPSAAPGESSLAALRGTDQAVSRGRSADPDRRRGLTLLRSSREAHIHDLEAKSPSGGHGSKTVATRQMNDSGPPSLGSHLDGLIRAWRFVRRGTLAVWDLGGGAMSETSGRPAPSSVSAIAMTRDLSSRGGPAGRNLRNNRSVILKEIPPSTIVVRFRDLLEPQYSPVTR